MTGNEIRQKFLKYFENKGHTIVDSSSLVPHDDPTLLFTNAGMNQFKDVFLGFDQRPYKRATTSQKCVRAGGKHNDLDTVGRTARHHTFFEMLGNFSFGDYFKRDAITFAWKFLTEELKLPKDKLYATIYLDDDEAFDLWRELADIPEERILRLGEKDNFWSMGDTGPCGPCSEILIDRGAHLRCDALECAIGKCDCDRWLEIWNLVFMQYNRDDSGTMTPLPRPSIDTGMGLERITSVVQNVGSNYDTDLIQPIIQAVEKICGREYFRDELGFPFRVIADHARSCTFLISDGVLPSNDGRGYVLRRILRRAVRFGIVLGVEKPFLHEMVPVVVQLMGDAYPEIREKMDYVMKVIHVEEERFHETLHDGMKKVEDIIETIKAAGKKEISGKEAFDLYDTYGFPIDLTNDIAEENGLTVDEAGFNQAMEEQKVRSRAARHGADMFDKADELYAEIGAKSGATQFVGYEHNQAKANVVALIDNNQLMEQVGVGQKVQIILNETPFYGESGGQLGDCGTINGPTGKIEVLDTNKSFNGLFIHYGQVVAGNITSGQLVEAQIDVARRLSIARNHSTTHLLHKALKEVLGDHVNQAGSLVEDDKLRFDFTHFSAVTAEELSEVEAIVNRQILSGLPINTEVKSLQEARESGATALFGEKYGEVVRVVKMGEYSTELCGGTHIHNTSEAGLFKLVAESSVGAGLRRIEGVTGSGALEYIKNKDAQLATIGQLVKAPMHEVLKKIESMVKENRDLEKEIQSLQLKLSKYEAQGILAQIKEIAGVKVLAATVSAMDMEALRNTADMLKDKIGSGVVVLGAVSGEKVNLVATVTKDLLSKGLHAGNIIKEVAAITGGGGGGRPDMAQAGGKDPDKLEEALAKVYNVVATQIK